MSDLTIPANNATFYQIKDPIPSDKKGRLVIGKQWSDKRFRVYQNDCGQILLDPVVEISQRELEFLADPEKLEAWNRAVQDSQSGDLQTRGDL